MQGRRFLWTKTDSLLVGLVSGVVRSVLYKAVRLCSEILQGNDDGQRVFVELGSANLFAAEIAEAILPFLDY